MATPQPRTDRRPLRGALLTLLTAALIACGGQVAQQAPDEDANSGSRSEAPATPEPEPAREAVVRSGELGAHADAAVNAQSVEGVIAAAPPPERSMQRFAPSTSVAPLMDLRRASEPTDRENYAALEENGIKVTQTEPVSTFSIDVDTGAYSNVRRFLTHGNLPPGDAVRVEELINYFSYSYTPPRTTQQPFSVSTELASTPWNPETLLLQIGIKGYDVPATERPASNLVFLIDVSGSMQNANKLPLLKNAFRLLAANLNERDSVAMVVYAGASGVVLPPTPGNRRSTILSALDQLRAGGSTNGGAGIRLAYNVARDAYIEGGINRVLLATDGDFNVGTVNFEALVELVERERETGVSLTTLGFGAGNYNDHLNEQLADAGNGNYAYIDNINEARKVLVDEMGSTLQTIAKDVKIQVEFNPNQVAEYRLIGYENRALNREDFNNDKVDAGEIGAGHTVTAIYELTPVGSPARLTDPLRYGQQDAGSAPADSGELAFVKLRYKAPGGDTSKLIEVPVLGSERVEIPQTSDDFRFAAAVAAFGQQLRGGRFMGDYALAETRALADGARGDDRYGYRREFVSLVQTAQALSHGAGVQISDRGTDRP